MSEKCSYLFIVLALISSLFGICSSQAAPNKGESLFVQHGDSRQEIKVHGFSGSFFDVISLLTLVPKKPQDEEPVGEVQYDLEVPEEDYNNEVNNEYIYEEAKPTIDDDSKRKTSKRRCVRYIYFPYLKRNICFRYEN